jgi:hypothetical protein
MGKFASQNAGNQIIRLEAVARATKGKSFSALTSLAADGMLNPKTTYRAVKALKEVDLPGRSLIEKTNILRRALVNGNTRIIHDIAPAFDIFLRAASANQDGVAALRSAGYGRSPLDPYGFIMPAFERYAEARKIADQIKTFPPNLQRLLDPDKSKGAKTSDFEPAEVWRELDKLDQRRRDLVYQANMFLGCQEQWASLQNEEVFGNPEVHKLMEGLSKGMALHDANGNVPLLQAGGNWAEFTDRMGLKKMTPEEVEKWRHTPASERSARDLVIPIREPMGGTTQYYVMVAGCTPGNISQYMNASANLPIDGSLNRMLDTKPERLSRLYSANPLGAVAHFFGGLKHKLFG